MTESSLYESWVNSLAYRFRNKGLTCQIKTDGTACQRSEYGVFGMWFSFYLRETDGGIMSTIEEQLKALREETLASLKQISAEWDRDGGDELYHLYAQACEERMIYSVLDLKNHILAQDEYEAKWYNWCDGFNQAATLLLKRKADETGLINR